MGACHDHEKDKEVQRISRLRRRNSTTLKLKPMNAKKDEGMFTENQLRDFVIKNFNKYDTSGDGNLDQKELTVFFSDLLKRRPDGDRYDAQ